MDEPLLFSARDGVGRITFNRPQARNALTMEMYAQLGAICAGAADQGLRALVLTGAGGKSFAAGTDIAHFRNVATAEDACAYEDAIEAALGPLERCPVPTIAAIAGTCVGGGAAIAACCDLRIAARGARFGFPIARTLGNCLSTKMYGRLAALIGAAKVTEIVFTARLLDDAEMLAAGFVSELLDDADALTARADALAALIAGHAPLTLRATKEALRRVRTGENLADQDLIAQCYASADFREGVDAFLNKRPPRFAGR